MSKPPTTGKRVQIYIPVDLVERWERLPRYERSAVVAKALRQLWGMQPPPITPPKEQADAHD